MTARRRRRRRIAGGLAIVLVAAGLATGTYFVGRWSAPLRTDSRSAAKPAPDVLVTAVRRQITLSVDLTAAVRPAAETSVPLLAPTDVARSVVTATPLHSGAAVSAGTVLLVISGRPVIALPGHEPAYRNLATGDTGTDVEQLQHALLGLGYYPDTDGTFGTSTGTALTAFYNKRGYTVIKPSAKTVMIPANELAYVPHLPAALASLPVAVGSDPTGKAVTIDSTAPGAVVAQLSTAASATAPPGTAVVLQCAGQAVHGHLGREAVNTALTSAPPDVGGNVSSTADLVNRSVTLTKPLPKSAAGAICAGTATVVITPSAVLAVPASAVYNTNDRGTVVHVRTSEATSIVPVTVGRNGGGWLELTNPPPSVTAGTTLVVGTGAS